MCVSAQPDTLGQWPFLYYYDFPEIGMQYDDSLYCTVYSFPLQIRSETGNYINDLNWNDEYAYFMHTDDTLKVAGIAYLTQYCDDDINRLTFYNNDMEQIARVKNSVYVTQNPSNNYANIDSDYYHLCMPEGYTHSLCGNQPLKLTFFENDSILDICGDFWIGGIRVGSTMANTSTHYPRIMEVFCLYETHQPPYHFHPRPFRYYDYESKEWEDLQNILSVPMLFPIIIPPCVGVDSVRTWVDSAGCLHAEWDSLRWQEQWVVALRADGLAQPLYDTVDSCRWSYCGLDSGAAYNVSVQSRCWNPGDRHTWSPFSHRTGTLGIAAQPAAPALHLSPNPAKDRVRVGCSVEIQTLSVVDAMGRTLITQRKPLIDIRHLPAGVYTVVAATTAGPASARLVVE